MTDQTPFFEQASDTDEPTEGNVYSTTLLWAGIGALVLGFVLFAYGSSEYAGSGKMVLGGGLVMFGGLSMLLWLTVKALRQGR
ncbi:hypothetical protein [Cryobacterium aureum]|uniref:hypothetical protein n=1 Tax=Cryobacterium aureum TaxID=995037 RepID=UPI000CF3D58E|nr:hypothetical protein [Cryobacterium aureum]